MYCTNYDYHGIYENGYNNIYLNTVIPECSICLDDLFKFWLNQYAL